MKINEVIITEIPAPGRVPGMLPIQNQRPSPAPMATPQKSGGLFKGLQQGWKGLKKGIRAVGRGMEMFRTGRDVKAVVNIIRQDFEQQSAQKLKLDKSMTINGKVDNKKYQDFVKTFLQNNTPADDKEITQTLQRAGIQSAGNDIYELEQAGIKAIELITKAELDPAKKVKAGQEAEKVARAIAQQIKDPDALQQAAQLLSKVAVNRQAEV
jgi:hypothetical protein